MMGWLFFFGGGGSRNHLSFDKIKQNISRESHMQVKQGIEAMVNFAYVGRDSLVQGGYTQQVTCNVVSRTSMYVWPRLLLCSFYLRSPQKKEGKKVLSFVCSSFFFFTFSKPHAGENIWMLPLCVSTCPWLVFASKSRYPHFARSSFSCPLVAIQRPCVFNEA